MSQAATLARQIRDIHPGPPLLDDWLDPRLQALLLLALALTALILVTWLGRRLWRYGCWCRALSPPDRGDPALWLDRLHDRLRQESLARWPHCRSLRGEPWLGWLDQQGQTDFRRWHPQWDGWLYGGQQPTLTQRRALYADYLRLGRRLLLGRLLAGKATP